MITNIVWAKNHTSGTCLKKEDIKEGVLITFPSGMGGVFTYKCISVDSKLAIFKTINRDFSYFLEMLFDQPPFDLGNMMKLEGALKAFSNGAPNKAERGLVYRAYELGYAHYLSHMQASWSYFGIEEVKRLKSGS